MTQREVIAPPKPHFLSKMCEFISSVIWIFADLNRFLLFNVFNRRASNSFIEKTKPGFFLFLQMDAEKANMEELLRRGEELLQQTSEEDEREELRVMLLRLQSQYSAHRVRLSCFLK